MRFKKGSKVEVMNNVGYDGYKGMEKVSRRFIKPSLIKTLAGSKIYQEEDNCLPFYNDSRLQNSHVVSINRKRASPFCSSLHESSQKVKKVKKVKPDEKDGRQRYISGHSYEKVDAFVGNNSLNGCYYEMEKRKSNGVARILEPNDDECSVGSCSVASETDNNLSSDEEESLNIFSSDDVAVSIHRLELHAYRSTLEALYASGPLSWEKEALLTNLRINLHISNDEHLTELRHLISSGASGILES